MPKGVDNPLILNQDTPEGVAARSYLFELFTNFCPVRFKNRFGIRMGYFLCKHHLRWVCKDRFLIYEGTQIKAEMQRSIPSIYSPQTIHFPL